MENKTMRISPNNITELKPNEIFTFGSNESGIHGAGAAFTALKWGAIKGRAFGLQGQTFAIPTKDWKIDTLPLDSIDNYVQRFIDLAIFHRHFNFLVTEIGCGLAGYKPSDIAPMFADALFTDNIYLPESFINELLKLN